MKNQVVKQKKPKPANFLHNNIIGDTEEEQERQLPEKLLDKFQYVDGQLKNKLSRLEYDLNFIRDKQSEINSKLDEEKAKPVISIDMMNLLYAELSKYEDREYDLNYSINEVIRAINKNKESYESEKKRVDDEIKHNMQNIIEAVKVKAVSMQMDYAVTETVVEDMKTNPEDAIDVKKIREASDIQEEIEDAFNEFNDASEKIVQLQNELNEAQTIEDKREVLKKLNKLKNIVSDNVKYVEDRKAELKKVVNTHTNPFQFVKQMHGVVEGDTKKGKVIFSKQNVDHFNQMLKYLSIFVDGLIDVDVGQKPKYGKWYNGSRGFTATLGKLINEQKVEKKGSYIDTFNKLITSSTYTERNRAYSIMKALFFQAFPPDKTPTEQAKSDLDAITLGESLKARSSYVVELDQKLNEMRSLMSNQPVHVDPVLSDQQAQNNQLMITEIKEGVKSEVVDIFAPVQQPTETRESTNQGRRGGDLIRAISGIGNQRVPSSVKAMLDRYGDWYVRSFMICRDPIQAFAKRAINLISGGEFDRLLREADVDDAFHTFGVVKLQDPQSGQFVYLAVEKNQQVAITNANERTAQKMLVLQLPDRVDGAVVTRRGDSISARNVDGVPRNFLDFFSLGINLLDSQLHRAGRSQGVWDYQPSWNNCQVFLAALTEANGMMDAEAREFIIQDTEKFFEGLDKMSKAVASGAVSTAQFLADLFQ